MAISASIVGLNWSYTKSYPYQVAFLSVQGTFTVALAISSRHVKDPEKVLSLAFEILEKALLELGVGAKTSSGYGQLYLYETPSERSKFETLVKGEELYEVTQWTGKSGFLTGSNGQQIYVRTGDDNPYLDLQLGDLVTCQLGEPLNIGQHPRAMRIEVVQRTEVQPALETIAVEVDIANDANPTLTPEPVVEPPLLEPATQSRDFDAEAQRLLSNAKVAPIRARFTNNPADVVSQFLTIADRCSVEVSREVGSGFQRLIQELGLEEKVREKSWFARLLKWTGE